jgi:cobalt-zinc-cadmium efflux system outer membrane protein
MRILFIPALAFCLAHAPSISVGAGEPGAGPVVSEGTPPRTGRILGWFRKFGSRADASPEVPPLTAEASPYFPANGLRPSRTDAGPAPPPPVALPATAPAPAPATRVVRSSPSPSGNATVDSPVRRVQAAPGEVTQTPFTPGVLQPGAGGAMMRESVPSVGGQSVSLQAALYGALTSNPDLATLRLGNPTTPSAEAVEVARNFPTTLNPTLWCDLRPITLIPPDPFGGSGQRNQNGFYRWGQFYFYLSLRQPVELGHQTTHRYHIAKAAYEQQRWTVVQAELLAMVQTYRFFETAAYRRERLKVARELADFNDGLLKTLERRLEANQVPAADVVLARVESRATRQLVKAAQQDYVTALTDLRNQIGIPESAGAAEPLGEFTLPPYIPPAREDEFIDMALRSRPEIRAAQAQINGTKAAECLARADRIPTPIIGPQYAMDEAGIQYIGLVYITPIPIWNSGGPLLRQRQAEHHRAHLALEQAQQRARAQVRSALAKWNGASELIKESSGLTAELAREVKNLERLFEQGQTDLGRLMQAQQRLIQLRTAEVDAVWAATQAQADLLLALGAPALIQGILNQTETAAGVPGEPSGPAPPPPVAVPSPFGASEIFRPAGAQPS